MLDASNSADVSARRQVFVVSLGGFDTHDNENRSHAEMMAKLAHGLRYFDTTLGAMGAQGELAPSRPATSAVPSPATATAPTTAWARTISWWAAE